MLRPRPLGWPPTALLLGVALALVGCETKTAETRSTDTATTDTATTDTDTDTTDIGPTCASALELYASLDCETLRPGVMSFSPRYTLWSDGISKARNVELPPGTTIDTRDPDVWVYPVGTRFWKHFETADGVRLETRVIEKVADERGVDGWTFETYAWNATGDDVERVTRGRRDVLGTDHDIPEEDACSECHSGGANQHDVSLPQADLLDLALGFGALQLNHTGSDTTLQSLWADGWLSHELDPTAAVVPGDETAREALGYLHVNCGSCHGGAAPRKDMDLVVPVGLARVEDTPTFQQTVGQPTEADSRADGIEEMPEIRITPGDPEASAIIWRMRQRTNDDAPMPPLASEVVHEAGIQAVSAWIEEL